MATRLDRLLLLLESGSTAVIRKSAAQQLGEVQKLHPHELNNLLHKVHQYLCSSQWETRIAAGMAVEAIASNVEQWKPIGAPISSADDFMGRANSLKEGRIQIQQFDVEKVLVSGFRLLGSHGAEYDVETYIGLDDKEKLLKQKQMMNKRLGLDNFLGEEVIKEEDFVMKHEPTVQSVPQSSIEELIDEQISSVKSDLSAREQKCQKRKAKKIGQTASDGDRKNNGESSDGEPSCKRLKMSNDTMHQPTDGLTNATDRNEDNTLDMDEIEEWPFEQFCELLMHDLFNVTWEKRHGAATGLRELIKLHGKGAGRNTDTPSNLMDFTNQLWLEDMAVRLVCVLALDRFGDFVSDEVVAPVRETCAQTLGATLRHMTVESVQQVLRILTQLLSQDDWEVRHGGLLGIKYLLAVRQDITNSLLSSVLPAVCHCLDDMSDDVRAVAADAILPVTDALVKCFPLKVRPIVETLWKILVDLDDLTASTNSIMTLLSSILSHPNIDSERFHEMSLSELVPRLWPFHRHNITSVRKAALKTFEILLSKSTATAYWLVPVLSDALRHIFQRCLLERESDLLQNIFEVWSSLLAHAPLEQLMSVSTACLGSWMGLMMQPACISFEQHQLIDTRQDITREHNSSRSRLATESSGEPKAYIAGSMSFGNTTLERDVMVIRARRMASRLLGLLSSYLAPISNFVVAGVVFVPMESLSALFTYYLGSKSALQKLCTAYTIAELITLQKDHCQWPDAMRSKLFECLTEFLYYDEVGILFTRIQFECRELIANLKLQGITLEPPFTTEAILTPENATRLCNEIFDSVKSHIKPNYRATLEDRRSSVQNIVTQGTSEHRLLINRVQCSVAAALICMNDLPEKMNPIVRPLMDAIKREENVELQEFAARNLAKLLPLCSTRIPCPIPKIIRNLCTMLCSFSKLTPAVGKEMLDFLPLEGVVCDKSCGVLMLHVPHMSPEPCRGRRPAQRRTPSAVDTFSIDAPSLESAGVELPLDAAEESESTKLQRIQYRGGSIALMSITVQYGADLPVKLSALWDAMFGSLKMLEEEVVATSSTKVNDDSFAQELVNSLQVLQVVASVAHRDLHPQFIQHLHLLSISLRNPFTAVRHMTSRCLSTLCRLLPSEVMGYIIKNILPWLSAPDSSVAHRQGGIECLAFTIQSLSVDIVPYIVLLVLPVLGRMSDHNDSVRLMATNVFATLVRLLPLERSTVSQSPTGNLLFEKQKEEERKFLEQLLDGKKIENFEISVPLNVELRKYQQEGVNWMAFLARYNLHGILCDDMGLGKTLQSLCILASDLHKMEQTAKPNSAKGSVLLPSIVVCPPTLTGHWLFEVEKLIGSGYLKPLHYVGPPSERIRLQNLIGSYNLVLASYDVVRNDIDFFSKIKWNYCILDEGQIIKNSKTKISKAVKQLNSNHRLILSGTPIQNNVLELWSLFDFLMPGYLGTEKQFQTFFGRPILQSRDAKSSTKEQEAGVLAMESLHRQVLPFLLRRLKEDVLQDLPPKIMQDYYCDLSPIQIQLYEDFARSQVKKSVSDLVDVEDEVEAEAKVKVEVNEEESETKKPLKSMHIFQALQYLRKVCNHPALVLTPQHPEFDSVMSKLKNNNSSLHDLHHAPKLVALKQLLNECGIGVSGTEAAETPVVNQHRVLLFCQLKRMLDIVEQDLFKMHMPSVTYLRLDGSVPAGSRHQIVNRFNNDPSIDVLLLTTQVGGLGLNLTGADTVIFFEHDWNPMKDLQAMDRAHRIGQKKVVNVYRLITRGTLEEKIMGLQRFKINIANTVINQENCSLASMGTSQLLDLFTVDRMALDKKSTTKVDRSEEIADSSQPVKRTLKTMLSELNELWESTDYENEYDVDTFISSLKNCDS